MSIILTNGVNPDALLGLASFTETGLNSLLLLPFTNNYIITLDLCMILATNISTNIKIKEDTS